MKVVRYIVLGIVYTIITFGIAGGLAFLILVYKGFFEPLGKGLLTIW